LTEPTATAEEHDRLKEARRLAAALTGSDATNVPLVHPIRWPGSWHRKGTPRMAHIVALNENAEVELSEALERLQEAAEAAGLGIGTGATRGPQGEGYARKTPDDYAELLAAAARDGWKHDAVVRLAASLAAQGCSEALVAGVVRHHCPIWDRGVEAAIRSAFAKFRKADVPPARPFDAILADAQNLTPDDLDRIEELAAEAASLNPLRQDQIFRAIKAATGIGLTTLRKQVHTETEPGLDQLDLARVAIERIGRENILCTGPFVWRWDPAGVWRQQDDRAIKQIVQNIIDEQNQDVNAILVGGVCDILKSEIYKPGHEFNCGNPECVNTPTGELELQNGRWILHPHRREHYRTTQIPVPYDPNADAPRFRAFLKEIFRDDADRDDKIAAVLELMGYSLMSHARHEKFVMLIGPGANGKSVLLAVLEKLCGTANVAGVQPSKFHEKFQRGHLHMKLTNVVTELKQGEVIADAELKAITSGEPATVEHKFKDPFVMRPFCTCWFGTNHMPHTRDFSDALFRRATITQFNRTFAKEEQDPTLKDKLCTELPGILNMVLAAYARAVAVGFTEPPSSEEAKREWRLEADQVAQFVEDECVRDPAGRVASSDLFLRYRQWADQNGVGRSMSQKGLRDRLTRLGFGAQRDRYKKYVTGLRMLNDW
jgi:putative DNA primase/helicase